MNQSTNSKFVPALPSDDDFNPPTNENTVQTQNSIKIYDGVAECTVNESDTFKNVKIQAKNLAQDNVHKKIADYVYGFMKDRLLTLPDDETLSIANEISNITGVKYSFIDSDDDNLTVRATVTAKIDSKDIMNYLISFFKEREEIKRQVEELKRQIAENKDIKHQNESLRRENEDLKRQNEELKRQLANSQQNNNRIAPKHIDKSKIDLARQKSDEAWRRFCLMDYNGAIKLYDEAIKLNPNVARFYQYRGSCYHQLGDMKKAQSDFAKAKEFGLTG